MKDKEEKELTNSEEGKISGGMKKESIGKILKEEKYKDYFKNNRILTAYGGPGIFRPAVYPNFIEDLTKIKFKNGEDKESTKEVATSDFKNE